MTRIDSVRLESLAFGMGDAMEKDEESEWLARRTIEEAVYSIVPCIVIACHFVSGNGATPQYGKEVLYRARIPDWIKTREELDLHFMETLGMGNFVAVFPGQSLFVVYHEGEDTYLSTEQTWYTLKVLEPEDDESAGDVYGYDELASKFAYFEDAPVEPWRA